MSVRGERAFACLAAVVAVGCAADEPAAPRVVGPCTVIDVAPAPAELDAREIRCADDAIFVTEVVGDRGELTLLRSIGTYRDGASADRLEVIHVADEPRWASAELAHRAPLVWSLDPSGAAEHTRAIASIGEVLHWVDPWTGAAATRELGPEVEEMRLRGAASRGEIAWLLYDTAAAPLSLVERLGEDRWSEPIRFPAAVRDGLGDSLGALSMDGSGRPWVARLEPTGASHALVLSTPGATGSSVAGAVGQRILVDAHGDHVVAASFSGGRLSVVTSTGLAEERELGADVRESDCPTEESACTGECTTRVDRRRLVALAATRGGALAFVHRSEAASSHRSHWACEPFAGCECVHEHLASLGSTSSVSVVSLGSAPAIADLDEPPIAAAWGEGTLWTLQAREDGARRLAAISAPE